MRVEKRGPPLEPPCTAHVVCSITGVSSTCTTADRMPEVTEGPHAWPKTPKPTTLTASPAREERRVKLGSRLCLSKVPNPLCPSGSMLACHFVSLAPRSAAIWGQVVFATQQTSPYDIAVVSLEEDLLL